MSDKKILYPDGTLGILPEDNARFYDKDSNQTYTWDSALNSWVDSRGEIFKPQYKQISLFDSFADHMEPDVVAKKTTLKTGGCECGSWIFGLNTKHTDYCPLYEKD